MSLDTDTLAAPPFYIVGGNLPRDAPCYVPRQADTQLLDGLLSGQFCYVLTSRQMGKSSLMVHTAFGLREHGVRVVALDLTAIGQNLTVEQWYDGLLGHVGRQLHLEDALEDYWIGHERLAPLQRWMRAIREVVLEQIKGPVVIFIDEVDAVQSLPFSADEFFAGIRECYNRRTEDKELDRLTFGLFGVAAPSDLIQDTRTTPFNIGQRIELTDFTPAEAAPLARGLGRAPDLASALLHRVLYWTNGHPYLTQRLCQAVAEDAAANTAAEVDTHCAAMFFATRSRESEDNLLFVRERMLRSDVDRMALLDTYDRILRGYRVWDDETDRKVSVLRLAGIVKTEGGFLRVRNRIYARAFDREWVRTNMPDAEVRRQRAAYRRGFVLATALSTLVIGITAFLALTAYRQAQRAESNGQRAEAQIKIAGRYLYAADMTLAQQAWSRHDYGRVGELLQETRPGTPAVNVPGFEWRFFYRRGHFDLPFFPDRPDHVTTKIAFCEDGQQLLAGDGHVTTTWYVRSGALAPPLPAPRIDRQAVNASFDGAIVAEGKHYAPEEAEYHRSSVVLRDRRTSRQICILRGAIAPTAFSPDARLAAAETPDGLCVWDAASGRRLQTFAGCGAPFAFAPDGRTLAAHSFSYGGGVKIFDVTASREPAAVPDTGDTAALSPDGHLLATQDPKAGGVAILEAGTLRVLQRLPGAEPPLAFMSDNRTLATGGSRGPSGTVLLWDATSGRETGRLGTESADVMALAAAHNGPGLAVFTLDPSATPGTGGRVELWNARTLTKMRTFTQAAPGMAFSPDDRLLAVWQQVFGVALFDTETGRTVRQFPEAIGPIAFSPSGDLMATGDRAVGHSVLLWSRVTGARLQTLKGPRFNLQACVFSPDGERIAAGDSGEYNVFLWDTTTGRQTFLIPGRTDRTDVSSYSLFFSPDGRRLYSGNQDDTLKIWEAGAAP